MADTLHKDKVSPAELASRPWLEEEITASQVTEDVLRPMDKWPGRLWVAQDRQGS